jgi:hypothetical protein
MSAAELKQMIHDAIEWAALGIEILAVLLIVAAVVVLAVRRGTFRYLFHLDEPGVGRAYKHQLGKALLLALDFLLPQTSSEQWHSNQDSATLRSWRCS